VPGNPSDTINFYDVTSIGTPGVTGVFNNSPMFSVWLGYEIFEGDVNNEPGGIPRGNREDTSALTFNSANGTIYAVAFDSGSAGVLDPVGDNQGDNDLYRIDYQEILADFVTNSRPQGTIYAPPSLRISTANETTLQMIGSPLFDGTVDGIANNIPHPASPLGVAPPTIFINNAISKIGEIGRAQSPFSFFDTQIDFVTPEQLVLLDTATSLNTSGSQRVAGDFQIRAVQRVSISPGLATMDANGADDATGPPGNPATDDDYQGGFNGNSIQSWSSLTMGRLGMDLADLSEPNGWAVVRSGGKVGLWVSDSDSGGDDMSYFELDFSSATPTATKKNLAGSASPTTLELDEDPTASATTNDGEVDYLAIDNNGNLVVGESGFFDTVAGSMTAPTGNAGLTAQQPRVMEVGIESYNDASGQILPAGYTASGGTIGFDSPSPWTVSGSISPLTGQVDDTQVVGGSVNQTGTAIDATTVAYDRATGYVYFIDSDADFVEDIYVFDPASGQIVYHEISAFNPGIVNQDTKIVFTRGDINGDGVVTQADVGALTAGISDPTLGGTVSASVGAEWYDLTGDGLLDGADLAELTSIIGAVPIAGDFDGDGDVDGGDLVEWRGDFGVNGDSDADGDGDSDGNDFLIWQRNLTSGASTGVAAVVPEPAGAALAAAACTALVGAARRRGRRC
jgi:hypothetical protein